MSLKVKQFPILVELFSLAYFINGDSVVSDLLDRHLIVISFYLLQLRKFIFIEYTQICWNIDLFFNINHSPATKPISFFEEYFSAVLLKKKSMKMSTSPS